MKRVVSMWNSKNKKETRGKRSKSRWNGNVLIGTFSHPLLRKKRARPTAKFPWYPIKNEEKGETFPNYPMPNWVFGENLPPSNLPNALQWNGLLRKSSTQ